MIWLPSRHPRGVAIQGLRNCKTGGLHSTQWDELFFALLVDGFLGDAGGLEVGDFGVEVGGDVFGAVGVAA